MSKISVAIITQDEEKNIRRCLNSVTWADEIVIVDSGSKDSTLEICREYTKSIFHFSWQGYGTQKQRAFDKTSGDWILSLDADEEVSKELQLEIKKVLKKNLYKAYKIPRPIVFNGSFLRYSIGNHKQLRLFKRNCAKMNGKELHESIVSQHPLGQIKAPIYHYSFSSIDDIINRMNHYSSLSAQEKRQNKQKGGLLKGISRGLWMFVKVYLFQRGFLDGRLGFIFAITFAEGTYYRYIKIKYNTKDLI